MLWRVQRCTGNISRCYNFCKFMNQSSARALYLYRRILRAARKWPGAQEVRLLMHTYVQGDLCASRAQATHLVAVTIKGKGLHPAGSSYPLPREGSHSGSEVDRAAGQRIYVCLIIWLAFLLQHEATSTDMNLAAAAVRRRVAPGVR